MNLSDGMTLIYLSIYFRWISIHWLYYEIFGFCIICTAFVFFLPMPESPNFLYSIKKYDQARSVLSRIARINRVKDYKAEFKFDTELAEVYLNNSMSPSRL
jgi:hypothetical protein